MDFLNGKHACMTIFFQWTIDNIRQILLINGTRPCMIDLYNKACIFSVYKLRSFAELPDMLIRKDIDLFRICTS